MIHSVTGKNCAEAWVKATQYVLANGDSLGGICEVLNMGVTIESTERCPVFHRLYEEAYGEDRTALKAYTFIRPEPNPLFPEILEYKQMKEGNWTATYWGRMFAWGGEFNQIEQTVKRLRQNKQAKTIVIGVYDPKKDGRKQQGGLPCLLTVDLKPRGGKLHLTATMRSQTIGRSGYGDSMAFVELCEYLAEASGCLEFGSVTVFIHSCHIRAQNKAKSEALKDKYLAEIRESWRVEL